MWSKQVKCYEVSLPIYNLIAINSLFYGIDNYKDLIYSMKKIFVYILFNF